MNFNMSIESTTRRKPWRVVWVLIGLVCIGLLSLMLFRLWLTRDTTSSMRPVESVATIRIIKTASNLSAIEGSLGNSTLIAGAPWTINDAFSWAKREVSFHFDQTGLIAVTIDQQLPDLVTQTSSQYGLYSKSVGRGSYFLGKGMSFENQTNSLRPILILPYFDGELIQYSDTTIRNPIELSANQMKIRGIRQENTFQSEILISENSDVLAKMWISGEEAILSSIFKSAFEGSPESGLLGEIQKNGAYVVLSSDNAGLAVNLIFQSDSLSLEQLALLGKEIINTQTLSTVAWTIEDGTTLSEIRTQVDQIDSDINSDESSNQITLSNSRGDVIRITKTGDTISMANRNIVLNLDEITTPLVCNRRAESFVRPYGLIQLLSDSTNNSDLNLTGNMITELSGIVFGKRSVILCW